MRRAVRSASAPLSGFLNLSAVSWQARSSRPCLMPLPFVGFSLSSSEVSPRENRAPLSGPPAPLRSFTRVRWRARPALVTAGFPRRPRLVARLPGSPDDYGLPFVQPRLASRSPWVRSSGSSRSARFTRFEASFLPRVRSRRARSPRRDGRASPEVLASLKSSLHASDPRPRPGPKATAAALPRRSGRCDSKDLSAPRAR